MKNVFDTFNHYVFKVIADEMDALIVASHVFFDFVFTHETAYSGIYLLLIIRYGNMNTIHSLWCHIHQYNIAIIPKFRC